MENSGTEIGRYTVSTATGGWSTYQTRTMSLSAQSGVHSLCLRGETGGGILNLDWLKLTTAPTAQRSDIVGKITVGYQGWFDAVGDGSGINPPGGTGRLTAIRRARPTSRSSRGPT